MASSSEFLYQPEAGQPVTGQTLEASLSDLPKGIEEYQVVYKQFLQGLNQIAAYIETPSTPDPLQARLPFELPQKISLPLDLRKGALIRLSEEQAQLAMSPVSEVEISKPVLKQSGKKAVWTTAAQEEKLKLIKALAALPKPDYGAGEQPCKPVTLCSICYPCLLEKSWVAEVLNEDDIPF
jgi:hypothetical protein